MWTTQTCFVFFFCGYFLSSGGRPHNGEDCDEKLAQAFSRFVSKTKDHNYLLWLLEAGEDRGATRQGLVDLGHSLHLDLFDPGQQGELATMVCHSPSLTFLSRMLGIPFSPMDDFVDSFVNEARVNGSLDVMFEVGEMAMELLTWMDTTDYPLTPLDNTDAGETRAFLENLQDRASRNEFVEKVWKERNVHFPVKGEAEDAAKLLSERHSTLALSEAFGFPREELLTMADMDSDVIQLSLDNLAATMRLYKLCDKYGILDLEWE